MKLLFYMGHPAHFHLFKESIRILRSKGHECIILIKTKDVLEELLQSNQMEYINVYKGERGDGMLSLIASFAKKLLSLGNIIRKHKPDVLIGSAAELAVLGKIFRRPSFIFFEDDFEAVPQFAKIAGPFASHLICPNSCHAGKWEKKAIKYAGYHELAYLAPKYFTAKPDKFGELFKKEEKNFLLRFSSLNAYHDDGVSGIHDGLAHELVAILKRHGNVFISSERPLEEGLEKYRVQIASKDMHDFLSEIDLFVGDSQTMTAEAAVLGTPSIRYNDFVGRLGYLEELEHKYQLTTGIKTGMTKELLEKVAEMAALDGLKETWKKRKEFMLQQSVDVNEFWITLFENNASNKPTS